MPKRREGGGGHQEAKTLAQGAGLGLLRRRRESPGLERAVRGARGRGGGGLSFLASRGLRGGGGRAGACGRETDRGRDQNVFNPRVRSGCGARGVGW